MCEYFWTGPNNYEDKELGIKNLRKAAGFTFEKALFGRGSPIKKEAVQKLRSFYNKWNTK